MRAHRVCSRQIRGDCPSTRACLRERDRGIFLSTFLRSLNCCSTAAFTDLFSCADASSSAVFSKSRSATCRAVVWRPAGRLTRCFPQRPRLGLPGLRVLTLHPWRAPRPSPRVKGSPRGLRTRGEPGVPACGLGGTACGGTGAGRGSGRAREGLEVTRHGNRTGAGAPVAAPSSCFCAVPRCVSC